MGLSRADMERATNTLSRVSAELITSYNFYMSREEFFSLAFN